MQISSHPYCFKHLKVIIPQIKNQKLGDICITQITCDGILKISPCIVHMQSIYAILYINSCIKLSPNIKKYKIKRLLRAFDLDFMFEASTLQIKEKIEIATIFHIMHLVILANKDHMSNYSQRLSFRCALIIHYANHPRLGK